MIECVNNARAKKYSAIKTRVFIADLFINVVSLAVFQIFFSGPVSEMSYTVSGNFYLACFIFSTVFMLFMYIVSFPLHLASSFFMEHGFGLSKQSFTSWGADEAKSAVLSFVLSAACIQVFYLFVRNFPHTWWLIAAVAWIFFSIILVRLMPVLLIPIFFKYLPLDDEGLKEGIMALAKRTGISLVDVCQIDLSRKTEKANAAVVGLGRTRKVILADTLIRGFSRGEIEVVAAHEFGHFRYNHIWKLLAVSGGVTLAGFFCLYVAAGRIGAIMGAAALYDLNILPVLVFLSAVFALIIMPAKNWYSRVLERQADRFALELTSDPESFRTVMERLAEKNLADVDPSTVKKIFLYSHPPIKERIAVAGKFAEREQ
ncbi:MAG: M48 family metallopeptidase [Candidatus Tantalella remota]|nr:M48 family metallopeptidase [Candidatus Tantalella remota]